MDADENTRTPTKVNLLFLVSSRIFWKVSKCSFATQESGLAVSYSASHIGDRFTNVPTVSTVFLCFTQTEIQSSFVASTE